MGFGFETLQDFADKVYNEDGVMGAIEYGLSEDDIPDDGSDDSKELYLLWAEARTYLPLLIRIDKILDKYVE